MSDELRAKRLKGYADRLQAQGHRKITVWLNPASVALLAALAPRYGSARAAIEAGLRMLGKPPKS